MGSPEGTRPGDVHSAGRTWLSDGSDASTPNAAASFVARSRPQHPRIMHDHPRAGATARLIFTRQHMKPGRHIPYRGVWRRSRHLPEVANEQQRLHKPRRTGGAALAGVVLRVAI